jgi:hypothetical protein
MGLSYPKNRIKQAKMTNNTNNKKLPNTARK